MVPTSKTSLSRSPDARASPVPNDDAVFCGLGPIQRTLSCARSLLSLSLLSLSLSLSL